MAHLLLVEDNPLDAQIAQIKLQAAGFAVTHAASVLEGEAVALGLLAPDAAPVALLILLDIQMPDPSHPELISSLLAAALSGRMQRGQLRPATMIALTSHVTPAVEDEALFAGCADVLAKPLTNQHATWLRQLVDQPVKLPVAHQGRTLYQQKAEEILRLVRRASVPNRWTEADAHLLLSGVSQFPAPKPLDSARQAMLILRLGGAEAVRRQLTRCAEQIGDPHCALLLEFLAGKQQRQMANIFPDYDRTTVYRHCQALPKRIAGWLSTL